MYNATTVVHLTYLRMAMENSAEALTSNFPEFQYDDAHGKLRRIAIDELVKTQSTIQRSPKLQQRGKPATLIERSSKPAFERLQEESYDQYVERAGLEAALRGVATKDVIYPPIETNVTYWELDGTHFVYISDLMIGEFTNDNVLMRVSLDFTAKAQLERIIPGLRLLCTPFYGAVLA